MVLKSSPIRLLDLEEPASWPEELLVFLDQNHQLFLDWENDPSKVGGSTYDRAIYRLRDVMQPFAITGWHCTRLTKAEIDEIISSGVQLPDASMLIRRIDALVDAGSISKSVAHRLKTENQADDSNRAGLIWFCFFPPRVGGQLGIERFFRHWGGEALYNSHERDPETSVPISSVGVPCLIEADVPIASLEPNGGLDFKVVRRFLIHHGFQTVEPVDHEDRMVSPLPAENIRRIIVFPEPEFVELTGCETWTDPIG